MNINLKSLGLETVRGEESLVERVLDMPIDLEEYQNLKHIGCCIGVTDQFRDVIETFHVPEGETPAGFKRELVLDSDGVIRADLVRDISYDKKQHGIRSR